MPVFEYTAQAATGEEHTSTIDLPSRDDVIAHLRQARAGTECTDTTALSAPSEARAACAMANLLAAWKNGIH